MDRRLPRLLIPALTAALVLALPAVPAALGAGDGTAVTRSAVTDATSSGTGAPALSSTALRLIDPGAAGPGFSAQPACHWGPGRPATDGAPPMCVHADQPPAGVDVTEPVSTTELSARSGARLTAGRAAQQLGVPSLTSAATGSAVQCYGTGADGNRVQAMYVVEQGRTNRYSSLVGAIQAWAAGVDGVVNRSAAMTGGTRHVRFVTSSSGGVCTPTVLNVVVPVGATADFDATITALDALGYSSVHRKYLIWADASVLCGIASVYQDSIPGATNYNNGMAPQYARIDTSCWGYSQSVEAHELVHTLGSVQPDAPHHTSYGHCYDEYDRMCYDDGSSIPMQQVCSSAWEALLDCGGDDYFSTAPTGGSYLATHWNTAASSFLSAAGSLRVTATADALVPGLPSTLTASLTLPSGRTLRSLTFRSSNPSCLVTRTSSTQGRLLCPATVSSAPSVQATAVDSAGQSATTTATPAISLTTRPATLELTVGGEVPGAAAWCDATGTLRARLVDDATGVAVFGLSTTFSSSPSSGGSQTTLGQVLSGSTGTALLRTPLQPLYLRAHTAAAGPWQSDTVDSAQALTVNACTGVLTAALSRSSVGYGDAVQVSGTLRGDAGGGHLVPLPGRVVTVTLQAGGRTSVLGRVPVGDGGTWLLPVRAVLTGTVRATGVGTAGVTADTASAGLLGVSPWATRATVSASPSTVSGVKGYRVVGRVVRSLQSSVGVPYSVLEVWYTPPHRTARRVAVLTTWSTGRFGTWVAASRGGLLRVRVLPRTGYLGSTSTAVRLS